MRGDNKFVVVMGARSHLGLALNVAVFLTAGVVYAAEDQPTGTLTQAVNRVYAASLNNIMQSGDKLVWHRDVRTGVGSGADLQFDPDIRIVLGERSHLQFRPNGATQSTARNLTLRRGVLRLSQTGTKNPVIHLATPHLRMSLETARVDILAASNRTEIAVIDGRVEVETPGGSVDVEEGQVYAIQTGAPPFLRHGQTYRMYRAVSDMVKTTGIREEERVEETTTDMETASEPAADVAPEPEPDVASAPEIETVAPSSDVDAEAVAEPKAAAIVSDNPQPDEGAQPVPKPAANPVKTLPATIHRLLKGRDLDKFLILETRPGPVVIAMRPDIAPNHVARIKSLVEKNFYDGITFHHVRSGFVAETGDPTGTGTGGSGKTLNAEISKLTFRRGLVGMKRNRNDINTADSQFFIMLGRGTHLDGKYTVWGRVIHGLENIDKLNTGSPPSQPDQILTLRLADTYTDLKGS